MYQNVELIGNLGRDPEVRKTASGMSVCNLSVATSSRRKKDDEWVEETEWHRVAVFNKTADNCARFLKKGSRVHVNGRLRTSSYEKDGEKRYSTEIVADRVNFLDPKGTSGSQSNYRSNGADEDIPF